MQVLVACHDPGVVAAFLKALRTADISAETAADGEAALELARRHRPDIVLLDDELPGLPAVPGLQTLAAELPGSAVVVITGRYNRGARPARVAGRRRRLPQPGAPARGAAVDRAGGDARGGRDPAVARDGPDRARAERCGDAAGQECLDCARVGGARSDGHGRLDGGDREGPCGLPRDGRAATSSTSCRSSGSTRGPRRSHEPTSSAASGTRSRQRRMRLPPNSFRARRMRAFNPRDRGRKSPCKARLPSRKVTHGFATHESPTGLHKGSRQ